MRRAAGIIGITALAAALSTTLIAQKTTQVHPVRGGSPHVKTDWTIDGAKISITYGRPFMKGRAEDVLMPAGTVWRTGADEATVLTTDKPLTFGSVKVPAGSYSLWTVPGKAEWQLVINKQSGQPGTQYDASQDLGRAPMKAGKSKAPAEQLTISIDDTKTGGVLRIEWGTTSATAAFTVG